MTDSRIKAESTVITIVIPAEGEDKPASLFIKQGDLGHASAFQLDDFASLCRALNTGLSKFLMVQDNPPDDIQSVAKKAKPQTKPKSKIKTAKPEKPIGKPPYHLLTSTKKRRELITMTDPFEVTEKCMDNRKLVFEELADAEEIAQMLVDAGETRIIIAFKNGLTAKVIGEVDETANTSDELDIREKQAMDYPAGIENYTQYVLYDHLGDVQLVLAIEEDVKKIKKYDWTNNLIKQREVKSAIYKHVDEEAVDDIYQIFFDIDRVFDNSEVIDDGSEDDETEIQGK